VRLWSRRRTMVVWSSSSPKGRAAYSGSAAYPGNAGRHRLRVTSRRRGRIRWWLRTGALLALIGVMRLARTVRLYPRPAVSLAGTLITMIGISLPSEPVLISGFLVLLLALFMPSASAEAPAPPCSHRLAATPLMPRARHLPPSN
jgi:hypothetical protein